MNIKEIIKKEPVRRAIRTFIQTAVGAIVAAVTSRAGIVSCAEWKTIILLAVSTGMGAVMNLHPPALTDEDIPEPTDFDDLDEEENENENC